MGAGVLEVSGLVKSFDDVAVLSGLTFGIGRGEVYGLLGPNGAGKTTCINIVCGLLPPDAGTVRLAGEPPGEAARRRIGVVPQEIALYRQLTGLENLRFFASAYGLPRAQRQARAEHCLEAVGLRDRADDLVANLSGGMQRRLNVAVGLIHQPLLLILDEPTVGLDLESRHRSWELVERLRASGSTVLLTTHYLEEAEALCDRIGIMARGRIAAEGSMAELRSRIRAVEVAVVHADFAPSVEARAERLDYEYRVTGDVVTVWLPERRSIEAVARDFAGLGVRSLMVRPVGLEHIYREVLGGSRAAVGAPGVSEEGPESSPAPSGISPSRVPGAPVPEVSFDR